MAEVIPVLTMTRPLTQWSEVTPAVPSDCVVIVAVWSASVVDAAGNMIDAGVMNPRLVMVFAMSPHPPYALLMVVIRECIRGFSHFMFIETQMYALRMRWFEGIMNGLTTK